MGCEIQRLHQTTALAPLDGLHSPSPPSPSALLLCCSNTAVGTHWEFMRKDDLFSQCMKKYRVHQKSRIFQVLFRNKRGYEEEIRTMLLYVHLLRKKNNPLNYVFSLSQSLFSSDRKGRDVVKTYF